MKMGKKVREYKSGDFIFAKVKGYPAWPARVQRLNGKKYFVYFYGTGETANLPPNMIFDYAENKDKFLTKTVKRKDFNLGVKQIEHDFANNVPVEEVVGTALLPEDTSVNDTINESAANDTMDESVATEDDTPAANDTTEDTNDTGVDDSDETGGLVIDEGKKGRKSKAATPAKPVKEPKTPRGKAKKEEQKEEAEEKKEEEIISRSGRKIRPKRYIDEHTEENTTLPSPAPKKRRGASPALEKEKEPEKEKPKPETTAKAKSDKMKLFNTVSQSELEDLKEPFAQEDADKENILIAYLSNGQYVGIRLFQSRPANFKNEAGRLQWDKQAATNALTLKMQLERGQITPQSVMGQLVTDLHLTDEEKATLDKERETEEKKSRVQFLKTEMKLIELDAKIKTCLCLEKADTELCLKLLDELMDLDVRPLMLLKHPSCLETVKRMRAYIGNAASWELSESAALRFNEQAQRIRKRADKLYTDMKELFTTPAGLSFFEYFSERVLEFKKVTAKLTSDELLEMVHEPIEMSAPTQLSTKTPPATKDEESAPPTEDDSTKKKVTNTPTKAKKPNGTQAKPPLKRQSSRKQQQEEKETTKEAEVVPEDKNEKPEESKTNAEENITEETAPENPTEEAKQTENTEPEKETETKEKSPSPVKESEKSPKKVEEKPQKKTEEKVEEVKEKEKEKPDVDEPRAKRTRESKKTEPPSPRSPSKRKQKL